MVNVINGLMFSVSLSPKVITISGAHYHTTVSFTIKNFMTKIALSFIIFLYHLIPSEGLIIHTLVQWRPLYGQRQTDSNN